ncbi:ankyrin repeat domain-containing protein 50-like [Dendronephthya gigantea]|uniref:ankyrin repeat domain-containing protein 50-like n=1 Tax=Dendronephthya gigantea TaxID=151771 RepID=UPI0010695736|nr:ankyrin repeat domain-containing protein 50-like [Dendronephthya gigantea]
MTSSKESRGVLLVADPGWGKSTIMRQLINSPSSSAVIHNNIIGYHFCKFNDDRTRDGGRFVQNLARSIARKIPKLQGIVVNDDDCKHVPLECFQDAIIKPLKKLDDTERRFNSYILIDALDECLEKDNGHRSILKTILYEMTSITSGLPSWVKLIVSSRKQGLGLKNKFPSFQNFELFVDDNRNEQDLRMYAEQKIRKFSAKTRPRWTNKDLIELVLQSSKATFGGPTCC